MRLALASLVALMPTCASAGVLTCTFTEPFFTIDFDTSTGIVMLTSPDEDRHADRPIAPKIIHEGAKLTRDEPVEQVASATLRSASGEVLLILSMSGKGSDGMSDRTYAQTVRAVVDGVELRGCGGSWTGEG